MWLTHPTGPYLVTHIHTQWSEWVISLVICVTRLWVSHIMSHMYDEKQVIWVSHIVNHHDMMVKWYELHTYDSWVICVTYIWLMIWLTHSLVIHITRDMTHLYHWVCIWVTSDMSESYIWFTIWLTHIPCFVIHMTHDMTHSYSRSTHDSWHDSLIVSCNIWLTIWLTHITCFVIHMTHDTTHSYSRSTHDSWYDSRLSSVIGITRQVRWHISLRLVLSRIDIVSLIYILSDISMYNETQCMTHSTENAIGWLRSVASIK